MMGEFVTNSSRFFVYFMIIDLPNSQHQHICLFTSYKKMYIPEPTASKISFAFLVMISVFFRVKLYILLVKTCISITSWEVESKYSKLNISTIYLGEIDKLHITIYISCHRDVTSSFSLRETQAFTISNITSIFCYNRNSHF